MKKISIVAAALVMSALGAAPAYAQTFDAFQSFTGTQGAGQFFYGEADPATPNTSGTLFTTSNTGCFVAAPMCLQRTPGNVPGFVKSLVAFEQGSVNVPNDRLLAHPGNDTMQTFLFFLAPTAGTYRVTSSFSIQDDSPTGVGINLIRTTNGGLPLIFTALSQINAGNPTFNFAGTFNLGASEALGFGIDNAGNFNFDSTGINFRVAAVPEPATWAMMMIGFGAVGASMRYRRRKTSVAFA